MRRLRSAAAAAALGLLMTLGGAPNGGALSAAAGSPAAWALTADQMGQELACLCGCGLTISNCTHDNCGFAVPARARIKAMLAAGKGREEILQAFTAQYGEQILAAPTKRGFNLAAWVTPFLVVAAGGTLIAVVVHQWVERRRVLVARDRKRAEQAGLPDQYAGRLDEELKGFDF